MENLSESESQRRHQSLLYFVRSVVYLHRASNNNMAPQYWNSVLQVPMMQCWTFALANFEWEAETVCYVIVHTICEEYDVALCVKGDCFKKYHTLKDIKQKSWVGRGRYLSPETCVVSPFWFWTFPPFTAHFRSSTHELITCVITPCSSFLKGLRMVLLFLVLSFAVIQKSVQLSMKDQHTVKITHIGNVSCLFGIPFFEDWKK